MSFLELCLRGDVLTDEIDDFVEAWHEGREGVDQDLHEYLGMSWEEYSVWSTNPSMLPYILSARRHGISFEEELNRDRYALAARAPSAQEAKRIIDWLKEEEAS
ncbi:hypothetical protein [Pseudomonas juntendi]|uniref:hypothetical protein n=1 Tax=Pseudomonas juntendi TaxID=2666183 RepID=UPI0021B34A98|nr:hypothetical protein [Pseudomonas juntendi]UXA39103.1 hypothetical protein KZA81_01605 [Pseudomonas juntendi]